MSKYSKPTVVEIICLFRFSLTEENAWTNKKPGELLEAFKDSYPNFEPTQDIGVGIHIKEGVITPDLLAPKHKYVYSDENNKCSITIAADFFAFVFKNYQKDYENWQKSFEPFLNTAWEKVRQHLSIKEITSIGLRYINHIEISSEFPAHDALNPKSEYLPAAAISNNQAFFNRSEIARDSKNTLIITAGIAHKEGSEIDRIVILDIDRVITDNISITKGNLPSELSKIQQEIEAVFESSVSDNLRKRMK
jgi:uncharacterized protein (TIGR04255 family)